MIALLFFTLAILASPFKSNRHLEAENAALRQQLAVLRRQVRGGTRNDGRWNGEWNDDGWNDGRRNGGWDDGWRNDDAE